MAKSDHNIIRDYVTAKDHLQYQQLPEGVVQVLLTHSNINQNFPDIRLDLHMTVEAVKTRFKLHIGTPVEHQRLILKDNGRVIGELSDNSKMLGYYSVVAGNELHVIDTDPYSLSRGGGLTDVTLVEKYKMDDETYEKRSGTMREYFREQRAKNPNYKVQPRGMTTMGQAPAPGTSGAWAAGTEKENEGPPPGIESVEGISIGDRCEVQPGARRGTVRWIGEAEVLKAGYWVGIQLDEPLGMNNGTIKGEKLFECDNNFGSMCRGKNVIVGDFPEVDMMASDGEDEDEEEI